MSQELEENVARAICEASGELWREPPFNHLHTDALNNHWRYKARAALAVVREDLEAAIQSTCDHASEHYKGNVALKIKRELLLKLRAMLSASPLGEQ